MPAKKPSYLTHEYKEQTIVGQITMDRLEELIKEARELYMDPVLEIKECYHEDYWYEGSCSHTEGYIVIGGWVPLPPEVVEKNLKLEKERLAKNKAALAKRKATELKKATTQFNKLAKAHPEIVKALVDNTDPKINLKDAWNKSRAYGELKRLVKAHPILLKEYSRGKLEQKEST